jgi:NaMN:DMB phosphoribosyltransferase
MGDPVLAAVAGFTAGALEGNIDVTLAGGTQLLAAAALVRAAGVTDPLSLATTSFVAEDVPTLAASTDALALDVTVTDPAFAEDHLGMERYLAGEGKEGVGMGGALALADEADALPTVRERVRTVYDRVVTDA